MTNHDRYGGRELWERQVSGSGRLILLVPMLFALVECGEHDRHNGGGVIADKAHNVLVIPEVESPLGNLDTQYIAHGRCGQCPLTYSHRATTGLNACQCR